MAAVDLPLGRLSWRPLRRDDLPAVHALVAAYEQRLLGSALTARLA